MHVRIVGADYLDLAPEAREGLARRVSRVPVAGERLSFLGVQAVVEAIVWEDAGDWLVATVVLSEPHATVIHLGSG